MEGTAKKVFVMLTAKDTKKDAKAKTQKFEMKQANALLSLSNPQWKLDDKGYTWNGKEIAKVK